MEFADTVVAFVGKFAEDTRLVQHRLARMGAEVARFEDPRVAVVVVGDKCNSKRKQATRRGLTMISLAQLHAALAAAAASRPGPQPRPRPKPTRLDTPHALMLDLVAVDPSDALAIFARVAGAREHGVVLDLYVDDGDAGGRSDPVSREANPDSAWLLGWCSDADGCRFYAVPELALDDARRADLLAVQGLCFADSSDTSPECLGAAIRLLAGMTPELGRDPVALADALYRGWSSELEGSEDQAAIHSAADLRAHIGWLADLSVHTLADLRRSFTRVIAVNQAM